MEESEEILIKSLINLGIEIPPHITSIKELDSSSFFSISSQSVHLLLHNTNTSSFPTSLPDSMPEKVNSCSHLASLLHQLSYPSQISFHQFLYPSEEDLYKLVRFLVERLSESSEARKTVKFVGDVRPSDAQLNSTGPLVSLDNQKVSARLHDMRSEGDAPGLSSDSAKVPPVNFVYEKLDVEATTGRVDEQETLAYIGGLNKKAAQVEETGAITEIRKPEQESISYEEFSPEPRCEVESICGQETVFPKKATGKDLEVHYLEEELELLKEAVKMALDDESSFSSIAEQLSKQIATRNENLQEAKKQWDTDRNSLEEKKWNLLESICVSKPDCQLKLKKLKDIDTETHSVLSETKRREEECAKLAGDMKKQPKVAPRKSYIERITEITKNSRKLDTDIERILKETRELRLESNSIEERLHRTYAVVDETIFREAKKDPVGRQAYRLLTNTHESFEKIREQILAADKAQREVTELEAKLSAIASRSMDKDKLQADFDAMKRENEHLEKTLMNR